jgi:hypothetical protein
MREPTRRGRASTRAATPGSAAVRATAARSWALSVVKLVVTIGHRLATNPASAARTTATPQPCPASAASVPRSKILAIPAVSPTWPGRARAAMAAGTESARSRGANRAAGPTHARLSSYCSPIVAIVESPLQRVHPEVVFALKKVRPGTNRFRGSLPHSTAILPVAHGCWAGVVEPWAISGQLCASESNAES